MTTLEPVIARARELLALRVEAGVQDVWLWEHTERVVGLARMIAKLPEFGEDQPDEQAVTIAALFHDAGWAIQCREGAIARWQVLGRPTNETQRELAATALAELLPGLVDEGVLQTAIAAIRECNNRYTSLPEAQALAEAENLEEVGVMYILRQLRQTHVDGRSLHHLLQSWSRQLEYKFWDARINDCLRFETTRRIAHARLGDVGGFMNALARDREGADLRNELRNIGLTPPLPVT